MAVESRFSPTPIETHVSTATGVPTTDSPLQNALRKRLLPDTIAITTTVTSSQEGAASCSANAGHFSSFTKNEDSRHTVQLQDYKAEGEKKKNEAAAMRGTKGQCHSDTRPGIDVPRKSVYPCFKISRFGVRAVPLDVTRTSFDADFFVELRKLYFQERSYLRRFFELREVKRILYIHVREFVVIDKCFINL